MIIVGRNCQFRSLLSELPVALGTGQTRPHHLLVLATRRDDKKSSNIAVAGRASACVTPRGKCVSRMYIIYA